jgi:rSAM/selenodomain-associated transferase 1
VGFGLKKDDPPDVLGVLAKYWEPGAVKTRLAATIGAADAARLHRLFLIALLRRMTGIAARKVLVFSPSERREQFGQLCPEHWSLERQVAGDLGRRMRCFFEWAFAAGARHVVLLGSDSPSVPTTYVSEALGRLQSVPVVLGPTADGGYYLIGLSSASSMPPIFDGVSWGTPAVWEQTVTRLRGASVTFSELPRWYDVDQLPDLRRLSHELTSATRLDAPLAALAPVVADICQRAS